MSVLVELNVEYNRFFSKAVIALAREDYVSGRMYLERAAKALNEIAVRRTGENRDYTQDWVFDIVKEKGIDYLYNFAKINFKSTKKGISLND